MDFKEQVEGSFKDLDADSQAMIMGILENYKEEMYGHFEISYGELRDLLAALMGGEE